MARVAIVGSCITRDLWPLRELAPPDLLYISRTSLISLTAPPVRGYRPQPDPPEGLTRYQHAAVETDLRKTGLAQLVAHRPSHIIFDFIDERFDLLRLPDGAVATHSWELEAGGYLADPAFEAARTIPRLTDACDRQWRAACVRLAMILGATPLRSARLILHSARWADQQQGAGGPEPLQGEPQILPGRPADLSAHNALLARYEQWFTSTVPGVEVICAEAAHRLADPGHRWGLSPFHYVEPYYADIREALAARGV